MDAALTYELTDDRGNRYGQATSLAVARAMANRQAQLSQARIYVYALAVSDWADGRYGERCYHTARPEVTR